MGKKSRSKRAKRWREGVLKESPSVSLLWVCSLLVTRPTEPTVEQILLLKRTRSTNTLAGEIWKRLFPARRSIRGRHRVFPVPRPDGNTSLDRNLTSDPLFPNPLHQQTTGMACCRQANPFGLCSFLRFLGYSMILLVAAIVGLSYYAVVVVVWGPLLFRGGSSSILAFSIVVVFHALVISLSIVDFVFRFNFLGLSIFFLL